MNAHESGFTGFLAEPGARRMRTLLEAGARRRHDVRELLDHAIRLDTAHAELLQGNHAFAGPIEQSLRAQGAPDLCFVISADAALDGREMPLREALDAVIGTGSGAFVSCIAGRLGCYEYAEARSTYLLSKPA